jgi:hypothetical protein
MSELGCAFPEGYPPAVAADMLTRQIFNLPYRELQTEMDRLVAARASEELSPKVSYSLFVLLNLIRRRLEGVSEDEIRRRAEAFAEIFAA